MVAPEKTPNLKLVKPDFENGVADIRYFNENWDILDEANKKIENEMTETNDKVDNGLKTKLDKGSYEGDAADLKREIDGKEDAFDKKSGFNKEKTSEYKSGKDAEKLFTQEGANNLYKDVETKVSKNGDTMTGHLVIKTGSENRIYFYKSDNSQAMCLYSNEDGRVYLENRSTHDYLEFKANGGLYISGRNLETQAKDVVAGINEVNKIAISSTGANNSIVYIQDSGTKEAGKTYLDKVTKIPYYCKISTSSTSVSDVHFIKNDNNSIAKGLNDAKTNVVLVNNNLTVSSGGSRDISVNLSSYSDNDLLYILSEGNGGGECISTILPLGYLKTSLQSDHRATITMFDGPNGQTTLQIQYTGSAIRLTAPSSNVYVRYACIIRSNTF